MVRPFAIVLLACATAHADPDFASCADKVIAATPAQEAAALTSYLHGATRDWDALEAKAVADKYDPLDALLRLAIEANDDHATARIAHLADAMESKASSVPASTYAPDGVRHEAQLAKVYALAGNAKRARTHFAAGEALAAKIKEPVPSVFSSLWGAAIMMKDDAAIAREQAAFLGSRDGRHDLSITLKLMAYEGTGRALVALAESEHVLHALVEGVTARRDFELLGEIIAKEAVDDRVNDANHVATFVRDGRREPAVVALVKGAIDAAKGSALGDIRSKDLVEAAERVGLGGETREFAEQIANPWDRAEAEALIASDLALTDPTAAIELAHAALKRAATKGARKDVINDTTAIDQARWHASIALARAGKLAEAKKVQKTIWPIDAMLGMRRDPKALAVWWQSAKPENRAFVLAHAAKLDPLLGDPSYLAPFCE